MLFLDILLEVVVAVLLKISLLKSPPYCIFTMASAAKSNIKVVFGAMTIGNPGYVSKIWP